MIRGAMRRVLLALGYGLLGMLVLGIALGVRYLQSRPELEPWHLFELDAEFTAADDVPDFAAYLAREEALFQQLDAAVARIGPLERGRVLRFQRGSSADPERWPTNWNRTFERPHRAPRAGVLLLHGLSDSPYSLRHLGDRLHREGAWVVGLRIPGHGTAPSGLLRTTWQDMAAAVALAARHLEQATGGAPLLLVGYSNGGALAVHHALEAASDPALSRPAGIVLVSPSIGVTRLAAFAIWQARVGAALGMPKLAWSSILPEYDPFKYNSFTVNAGDQVHRVTSGLRGRIAARAEAGELDLPPTLAFQSAVDSTVSTAITIEGLYDKLPAGGGHELVLFDINREADVAVMLQSDPATRLGPLLRNPARRFTVSVVRNVNEDSREVVEERHLPGAPDPERRDLDLAWPPSLYSLSHIALPFPQSDPLYGQAPGGKPELLNLGGFEARGELGVLRISGSAMLRLRWNPFYHYLEDRVAAFAERLIAEAASD